MVHRTLLVSLVVAAPLIAFAPSASAQTTQSVREFVRNDSADAWTLGYAWMWRDGALVHVANVDTDVARQVSMPAFAADKDYRIDITFADYLRGTVALSLGEHRFAGYGADGRYTFRVKLTDPNARLTLTPSIDYEGTIAKVRVVELGAELATGAVPDWTADGRFAPAEGNDLVLDGLALSPGHTYQVMFTVANATGAVPGAKVGMGRNEKLFSRNGYYSLDVVADARGRLVFEPRDLAAVYDGAIGGVSVREITSEPARSR